MNRIALFIMSPNGAKVGYIVFACAGFIRSDYHWWGAIIGLATWGFPNLQGYFLRATER